MAATSIPRMQLGDRGPHFTLPDVVTGKNVSLSDLAGSKAYVVMFICRHCPYVKHVQQELAKLGRDYASKGVGLVAIGANDVERYPGDAPDKLKEMAEELGFTFPFLYDESQGTAKAYTAACTPDVFVLDGERKLVYRGQLDDSRPNNGMPVTGADLRAAIDATLAGKAVNPNQKPSVGCGIKWKPGNEPG